MPNPPPSDLGSSSSFDQLDTGETPATPPENIKKRPKNPTAVAITAHEDGQKIPRISAAGRGKVAEQILDLAFANGIKVREDSALAEMLAKIELDSPIPSETFLAVAEILSYVYRANGEPNPFDAILSSEASLVDKETSSQETP